MRIALLLLFYFVSNMALAQKTRLEAIEQVAKRAFYGNDFSGCIQISGAEDVAYHKAFGLADRTAKLDLRTDSRFRIAGITEAFTAVLVLRHYEQGHLPLSDPIAKYLPGLLPNENNIQIRHLLKHTSGLHYPNPQSVFSAPLEPREIIQQTVQANTEFEPGTVVRLNPIDYMVLGLLLEKLEQKPWHQLVDEHIIKPLKLTNTGVLLPNQPVDGLVHHYFEQEPGSGSFEPDALVKPSNFYASGSMYSSTEDLSNFATALLNGQLIGHITTEMMFHSERKQSYIGMGCNALWHPGLPNSPRMIEFKGRMFGANALMLVFPDTKLTVVILANNTRFNPDAFNDPDRLRFQLLKQLF